MLSDNIIQQAKNVSILEIVGTFTTLRRHGNGFIGLCPFHDENTPSFNVQVTKGYKCFGCDAAGANAIDFLMAIENIPFVDAVQKVLGAGGVYVGDSQYLKPMQRKQAVIKQTVDVIPDAVLQANFRAYKSNQLFVFLSNWLGEDVADSIATKYGLASCNYLGKGSTLFIQRDDKNNIRQIKAMLFNVATGKRCKEKEHEPKIIGRQILAKQLTRRYESINLVQCYFGSHLLMGNTSPVALVESEKTCMIASLFYPSYVWLATGGKNGCRWYDKDIVNVLKGRDVYLFPDADAVEDWRSRIIEIKQATGGKVVLIDIMDGKPAPKGKEKYDIADFLIDSKRLPQPIAILSTPFESITIDDIVATPCTVDTGKQYDYISIVTLITNANKYYDVLFYPDGQLVCHAEPSTKTVKQLAIDYGKHFKTVWFMGTQTYACAL